MHGRLVCGMLWWSVCGREFIGAAWFLRLVWVVPGSNPKNKIRRSTEIGTRTLATMNAPTKCEK